MMTFEAADAAAPTGTVVEELAIRLQMMQPSSDSESWEASTKMDRERGKERTNHMLRPLPASSITGRSIWCSTGREHIPMHTRV